RRGGPAPQAAGARRAPAARGGARAHRRQPAARRGGARHQPQHAAQEDLRAGDRDADPALSAPVVRGLYALADDDPRWGRDPVEQARAALAGGAAAVQLRAKHATDRAALAWARAIGDL